MSKFVGMPPRLFGVLFAMALIFSPLDAHSASAEANELFVNAVLLHREAADLPPEERDAKLREVRDLFDRILVEHPDSDAAEQIKTSPAPAGVALADLPPSSKGRTDLLRRFQDRYPDDFSAFRAEFGSKVAAELAVALMESFDQYGIAETVSTLSTRDGWGFIGFARGQNLDKVGANIAIEHVAKEVATQALEIYASETGAEIDSAMLVELGSPAAQFIIAGVNGASGAAPAISAGVVAGMQAHYAARASYNEDARFEEVSENLVAADAFRQVAAALENSGQHGEAERLRDLADAIIEAAAQDAKGVFKGSDGPIVAGMLREMDEVVQLLRAGRQQEAQDLFDAIHISAEESAPGFFSLSTNNAYERYFMLGPQNRADSLRAFDQLVRILHAIFDEPNAMEHAVLGRERVDEKLAEASKNEEGQQGSDNLGPWALQNDPDLRLAAGEQARGFAVSADGAATFRGAPLFADYRAPEPDYQRLVIFVDEAERRAVALFMRDGAERIALVDLEAGTILNDAPRPFWRYGPTDDVIWDPSGRYAAIRMPMAEYSTGLGIFELETGRYATVPDREFDANALDSWLAHSLETRSDGTVAVKVALENLDEHGTPMPSDGTPSETRIIEIEAFFDGSTRNSESASDETDGDPETGALANQVWDARIIVSAETGIFNRWSGDLVSPMDELRAAGASEEAVAFSRAFSEIADFGAPGEFVAVAFTELGALDLVGVEPAYTPGTSSPLGSYVLVAADGTLHRLDFPVEMNRELERYATDRTSRRILAGQPDPWVVDYYVTGHRRLPGGAQRFVLQGPVSGSCRVCEWIGHAIVYVDVDERGDVLRQDLVGIIADAAVPDEEITPADIVTRPDLQQYTLNKFGYDAGPMDGAIGPRTRQAINAFQRERCLEVTGTLTGSLARALARLDALSPTDCAARALEKLSEKSATEEGSGTQGNTLADDTIRSPDDAATWVVQTEPTHTVAPGKTQGVFEFALDGRVLLAQRELFSAAPDPSAARLDLFMSPEQDAVLAIQTDTDWGGIRAALVDVSGEIPSAVPLIAESAVRGQVEPFDVQQPASPLAWSVTNDVLLLTLETAEFEGEILAVERVSGSVKRLVPPQTSNGQWAYPDLKRLAGSPTRRPDLPFDILRCASNTCDYPEHAREATISWGVAFDEEPPSDLGEDLRSVVTTTSGCLVEDPAAAGLFQLQIDASADARERYVWSGACVTDTSGDHSARYVDGDGVLTAYVNDEEKFEVVFGQNTGISAERGKILISVTREDVELVTAYGKESTGYPACPDRGRILDIFAIVPSGIQMQTQVLPERIYEISLDEIMSNCPGLSGQRYEFEIINDQVLNDFSMDQILSQSSRIFGDFSCSRRGDLPNRCESAFNYAEMNHRQEMRARYQARLAAKREEENRRRQEQQMRAAQAQQEALQQELSTRRARVQDDAKKFIASGQGALKDLAAALEDDELNTLARLEKGISLRLEPVEGITTVELEGQRLYRTSYSVISPFWSLEQEMRSQQDFSWGNFLDMAHASAAPRTTRVTCLFESIAGLPREARAVKAELTSYSSGNDSFNLTFLCE